jgi:hypothetical protein
MCPFVTIKLLGTPGQGILSFSCSVVLLKCGVLWNSEISTGLALVNKMLVETMFVISGRNVYTLNVIPCCFLLCES